MWTFDLPLEDLKTYKPPRTAQPDFDEFWERTKAEGLAQPLNPELVPIDYPVKRVQVFSATFDGYAGGSDEPPRAGGWYFIPEDPAPRPALVIYHGYHGYRDRIASHLHWALLGFAVLPATGGEQDPDPDKPTIDIVSSVGCVAQDGATWTLTRASEPVVTRVAFSSTTANLSSGDQLSRLLPSPGTTIPPARAWLRQCYKVTSEIPVSCANTETATLLGGIIFSSTACLRSLNRPGFTGDSIS